MIKTTEERNTMSNNLDTLEINQILKIINNEDKNIPNIINNSIMDIANLIEAAILKMKIGGRLFYVGCGTSGRLGVLDASECPPTFSVNKNVVIGIIAGGNIALTQSVENAEDSEEDGKNIIIKHNVSDKDVVIGISASSTASFVEGALKHAFSVNALTGLLCCNNIENKNYIDHLLSVVVGPEVISGSTRMKAGTATKLILNMISTTIMIKLNKTYGNYMVDLTVSNAKLLDRGIRIVSELTNLSYTDSKLILDKAKGKVKNAILMYLSNINYRKSVTILDNYSGNLRNALNASTLKK